MGRRSSHTPDQLRELIITAASDLVIDHGLVGLSAREIARKVGYSPGTIYNVFRDLDDLIFTIETRMLDRLAAQIAALPPNPDPSKRIAALAHLYLQFSLEKPRIWNLLMEHVPASRVDLPLEFKQRIDAVINAVETVVAPLVDFDKLRARRITAVLWAGLHGISTLATAQKLSHVTSEEAAALVDDFVAMYTAGIHFETPPEPQVAAPRPKKRVPAKLHD